MVRLENWSLVLSKQSPYFAPEMGKPALKGMCYGHQKYPDGETIRTTSIVFTEGRIVRTQNTTYLLGEIDPAYEAWVWLTRHKSIDANNPIKLFDSEL